MNGVRRIFRFWNNRRAEVEDELAFHLEARVEEFVAAGMTPEEARTAVMARFGSVDRVRADCATIDASLDRERRRAGRLESLRMDLRYALRGLRRSPGFTAVAILTLALGIGANTAVFSVVNGVLLRPLPYPESERLVRLFTTFSDGADRYSMSQPEFMDYKGLSSVFADAAAWTTFGLTLTGAGEAERLRGAYVTRDLLPVLGVTPLRGRNFRDDEGRQGTGPVVILSHAYWQSRFGGEESVLGRTLALNGVPRQVVGILPPGAEFAEADAIVPIYIDPAALTGRSSNYLNGVARLRDGVTPEAAQAALNALAKRSRAEHPETYPVAMGYGATVIPLQDEMVGDVRSALLILLGAVGLVLLIACANVAHLLLARGEARQRDLAVRLAIGAGRGRVIRQLLTESTALAVLGAAVGMLVAWWGTRTLLALAPGVIPRMEEVRIDLRVALVTLAVTLATGLLFGLAPALQLTRTDLQSTLREGGRSGSDPRSRRLLGRSLVIGEIALAVVVVTGAALLVRSFRELNRVDPGFRTDHLLAVDLNIPAARYDGAATTRFYRELVQRLGALPGVQTAAAASAIPPAAESTNWDITVDGRVRQEGDALPSPNIRFVTGEYFATMQIPLLRGRGFQAEDREGSAPVAILNEATARLVWPGADPVGQRIRFSATQPWVTVIGIARDVHSQGLGEAPPAEVYLLHEQLPGIAGGAARSMYLVLRTVPEPGTLAQPVRALLREMDPLLAATTMRSVDDMLASSVARPRFVTTLLGAFGGTALLLAMIGIYGLMAYGVKRRTREIGIRMALGAERRDVIGMIVRQGMALAGAGLVAGLLAAAATTRLMSGLLFGVSATDPLSYGLIALLVAGVSWVAIWIPARRAVRTDPVTALRD